MIYDIVFLRPLGLRLVKDIDATGYNHSVGGVAGGTIVHTSGNSAKYLVDNTGLGYWESYFNPWIPNTYENGAYKNMQYRRGLVGTFEGNGHVYLVYTSNGDATCTTDGTKTAYCANGCGETQNIADDGSAKGHKFVNYQSNNDATCDADGTKTSYCANGCGVTDVKVDLGSALGHDYDVWVSNGDGTHTKACLNDPSHNIVENCYGGSSTCTQKATCVACKSEYGELGHKLPADWVITDTHHYKIAICCGERVYYAEHSVNPLTGFCVCELAMDTTPGLNFVESNDGSYYTLASYSGVSNLVNIPAEHQGKPVKVIGEGAFANKNLKIVIIPNTIELIGANAFYGNDNLTYNNKDGLLYLGNDSNKYLYLAGVLNTDITVSHVASDCTIIGHNVFEGCNNLTAIILPNGLVSVGVSTFENCDANVKLLVNGNSTDWENVILDGEITKTVYFYSESEPQLNADQTTYNGNYWHYVGRTPTVWVYNFAEVYVNGELANDKTIKTFLNVPLTLTSTDSAIKSATAVSKANINVLEGGAFTIVEDGKITFTAGNVNAVVEITVGQTIVTIRFEVNSTTLDEEFLYSSYDGNFFNENGDAVSLVEAIGINGVNVTGAIDSNGNSVYSNGLITNLSNNTNQLVETNIVVTLSNGLSVTMYVKVATLVIDEAEDFKYFTYKGDFDASTLTGDVSTPSAANAVTFGKVAISQGQFNWNGYYMLAKDIDAQTATYGTTEAPHMISGSADIGAIVYSSGNSARWYKANGETGTWNASYANVWSSYNNYNTTYGVRGFSGTFDGNGHTISNFVTNADGIFGFIRGGTIKNLGLINSSKLATLGFGAKVENLYRYTDTATSIIGSADSASSYTNVLIEYYAQSIGYGNEAIGEDNQDYGTQTTTVVNPAMNNVIFVSAYPINVGRHSESSYSYYIPRTEAGTVDGVVPSGKGVKAYSLTTNLATVSDYSEYTYAIATNTARYTTLTKMIDAYNSDSSIYAGFTSDVWSVVEGKLIFGKAGHTFSNYISNDDATCTTDGTKTAYCDCGCGLTDTIVDVGSALGHYYSVTDNGDGTHTKVCRLDGDTVTEEHIGHNSCDSKTVCEVCNAVYGTIGEHDFSVLGYDQEYHWYACANCDDRIKVEKHYGTNATCTESAYCYLCEQNFGEALGHTYSDKWSANDTHHWKQALCCDQVIDYAEHSFDSTTGLCSTCGISGTGTNGVVYTAYTNYASVTGYTGKADVVTIASTYQGLPVTTISANAFNAKAIKQVIIPASVTTIYGGAFADSVLLENITVAQGNTAFKSIDGNLYTIDGKALVQYAVGSKNAFFSVPAGVTSIGDKAFYNCMNLTGVSITSSVTTIGDSAFYGCGNLIGVKFGGALTEIGDNAFAYCFALKQVDIPDNVSVIGDKAFYGDVALTEVNFGTGLTTIGASAFNGCVKLAQVTLPENLSSLGDSAFAFCYELTSLTVTGANTYISDMAFYNCSALYNVKLGKATSIGNQAFYNCLSITALTIPNTIVAIGDSAFYNCSALKSLIIPDSVTAIGSYAFYNCSNIVGLKLGNGLSTIGEYSFAGCSKLSNVIIGSGVTTIEKFAFAGDNNVAKVTFLGDVDKWATINFAVSTSNPLHAGNANFYIKGQLLTQATINVTNVSNFAFAGCNSLEKIILTDSVITVGDYAFANCLSVSTLNLGNNVTTIGQRAFAGMHMLSTLTLPDSVTTLGYGAFLDCHGLQTAYLGANLTTVEGGLFQNCPSLTIYCKGASAGDGWNANWNFAHRPVVWNSDTNGVADDGNVYLMVNGVKYMIKDGVATVIKQSVTTKSCIILSNVTYNGKAYKVTSIEDDAFAGCNLLESVIIGLNVTAIGDRAFSECSSLKEITIGGKVECIGEQAFSRCVALNNVTFGNSVTTIGAKAFAGCSSLTFVAIGNGVTSMGTSVFANCSALEKVVMGDALTEIVSDTFADCVNLKQVVFGKKITTINDNAFTNCGMLTDVYLTETIVNIRPNAFAGAGSIKYTEYGNAKYLGTENNAYYALIEVTSDCLTTYTINPSVKVIANRAFANVNVVKNLSAPINVFKFVNLNSVERITILAGQEIYAEAFSNLTNLKSVVIAEGVESIGNQAFAGCTSLENVQLPNTLNYVGKNVFAGCDKLNVTVEDGLTYLGSADNPYLYLYGTTSKDIDHAYVEDKCAIIGSGALANCKGIRIVYIGEGVKFIGEGAFINLVSVQRYNVAEHSQNFKAIDGNLYSFDGTALVQYAIGKYDTSFTISSSVKTISKNAFLGSRYLTEINFEVLDGWTLTATVVEEKQIELGDGSIKIETTQKVVTFEMKSLQNSDGLEYLTWGFVDCEWSRA